MQQITRRNRLPVLIAALVLFATFAVLSYAAKTRNLRADEGIVLESSAKPTLQGAIDRQIDELQAPLYFGIAFLWQRLVGDGEFTYRWLSVLVSLLTLALIIYLGKGWLGGAWTAIVAAFTLGLSSYFFAYAVEIRPYPLVMLVATLSTAFFVRWLERSRLRDALLYALTVAMMLYIHYLGALMFALHGLYFVFYLIQRRKWQLLKQAIAAFVLAFVVFLPWLPTALAQVHRMGQIATADQSTHVAGIGVGGTTLPTTPDTVNRFILLATNEQPMIFGLILLIGLILLWRKRLYWLVVAWGIGVPIFFFLVNLLVSVYEPRYASTLVPGFGLLVGISLAAIPFRALKGIALLAFAVIAIPTMQTGVLVKVPLREYMQQMESDFRPGDGVYLDRADFGFMEHYQYSHYAPSALAYMETRRYKTDTGQYYDALPTSTLPRCVWFITKYWFDPTVRADFAQLSATRPLQLVVGSQDYTFQRLCAPPNTQPQPFGDAIQFLGMDIQSVTKEQLTVKLWWAVAKPPTLDYSISVRLLNDHGALVAQSDGPINDFYGRGAIQTSSLQPGNYYIDLRTIALPATLPPGRYTVALTVYQSWDNVRLPVAGTADNLLRSSTIDILSGGIHASQ